VHADLSDLTQVACNDLVVDKDGRAYVTSVGFDLPAYMREHPAEEIFGEPGPPRGNIVCIDPDGVAHRVAHDLRLPNGAVITPDGGTLIVAETTGLRLSAYTIEPGGTLTERRVWAHLGMLAPDGICLNARGQIWVANPLAPECVLMGEGGQVIDRVEVDQFCYACMLGGPTRQTLFMLTAHNYDPEHADQVRSGHILALEVAVPGVGFP
ncbi:MAG TPA: SMP-30/gluconolactonase/LRE family protein, partial [Ktedonobacteraceae bacterium]|nr:SMP-30/gluconolactonase/LRE family protein [Ktedonobacteraceae bacterium]